MRQEGCDEISTFTFDRPVSRHASCLSRLATTRMQTEVSTIDGTSFPSVGLRAA